MSKKLSSTVVAAAALVPLLMGAGQAHADAYAPYAQAAASVAADGTIQQSTDTVIDVDPVSTGRYCVTLSPEVDVANSVPVATLQNAADWGSQVFVDVNHSSCAANSVRVTTGLNGAASDQPFNVIVP